ncbi:MAG TPA: hypothetical protein VM187_00705, partial [Niastella sp.]|nr:hypothetical protein [Niastella sp.]
MTKYILVLICLVCLLTVLTGYGQESKWLTGTWRGVYFGEKSKLTKTFDTRLQITKVNGSSFEGIVQCILPGDTSVRLHTRITGRVYAHHIMTKLKEVVYYKDPPGRYTWAKHCNLCDSMKYTFDKEGDSVVLQGERRCDTLCNIVARYSKNIGSLVYKAAFMYDTDLSARKFDTKTVATPAKAANTATTGGVTAKTANVNNNVLSPPVLDTKTLATPLQAADTSTAGGVTAKTGNVTNAFNFVKPVYKDSMVGREFFAGRTVSTPNRYVINADSVEVRFMDNGIVDGDTISVFYNGQLIVPKLSLKERPYIMKLPLYPDYPNRLVIHAESLGEYPP